jgi:hypothetical protein
MLEWFSQKRAEGTKVSCLKCAKQAQYFFEAYVFDGKFSASSGWATKFEDQHVNWLLTIQG